MSKKLAQPKWYKNTYFWIALFLLIVAVVGLVGGQDSIRDPGQKHENGLVPMYLVAAVCSLINGWISHRKTVRDYGEEQEDATTASAN